MAVQFIRLAGRVSIRIKWGADRIERRRDLLVYWCFLLTAVLSGRLAEGASKKPAEVTLIRKSAVGRHVGD